MTTIINRRTALAGAAAGTLIPVAGLAQAATTANATDAAWAELEAAKAHAKALSGESHAFNAALEGRLPGRLKEVNRPMVWHYERHADFKPVVDAWNAERDSYGVNPYEHDGGPMEQAYDRIGKAQMALIAVPGTSATDMERKLSTIAELADENMVETWWIESLLADVRRINGRVA